MQQELTGFQLLRLDNLVRQRVGFNPGPPLQIKHTPRCNRIKDHALEQGMGLLELPVLYFAAACHRPDPGAPRNDSLWPSSSTSFRLPLSGTVAPDQQPI